MILDSIKLNYIFEGKRRIFFLVLDVLVSLISYWFAFLLRFEGSIPSRELSLLGMTLPLVVILRTPCFIYFGLYQTLWQYLGIQELLSIIKAVTVGSVLLTLLSFFFGVMFHPRSVCIIDWLLLITAIGGSRVVFKMTAEKLRNPRLRERKNVLIVGAEDTGELLVREFLKRPSLGYRPVGFVDDDREKLGVRIHGVKVIGRISQLSEIAKVKKVDEVIIALPEVSSSKIKDIIRSSRSLNLMCRIIPPGSQLLSPQILPLKLRPVDVSDLLGRELVQADFAGIQQFFHEKRVLITGGGGSIGSELARTILQYSPRELLVVDCSENNLYEIQTDLQSRSSETEIRYYLSDVTDRQEMEKIFERHKPHVVYHAAAYKQVPLVETHFGEGIINNIIGTKVVSDLTLQYHTDAFILISTDKAIRPCSIMGATKRIAELYTQSLKDGKAHFLTVRFGNVFNSKGSVVPLFKKQIEEGGPITITDPEVTRYFMDLSEAVFLILQATILGADSEIFVLDMGEPIKIVDLAYGLMQLMGLSRDAIPIRYIGLRPGEKLKEELKLDGEQAIPTKHKKIKIWKSENSLPKNLYEQIDQLVEMVHKGASRNVVVQKLKEVVPEYEPWKSSQQSA